MQQKKPNKGVMAPTRTSTPSQTASPVPPPTPSNNKPYEGDIEKRDFRKTDNVRYNVTDSTTRNNCMGLMYNGLAYMSTDSIETVTAKATEVEAAAFKHFGGENAEYRAKMRSLFQNLKVKSNRELRRRVMSGEIAAIEFIKMSQDELKSQEHKERDKAYEKENINNAQVAQPEKSISDALTCGKCGQKKVSYTQAQTRSADEPMTTFCECLACGNRWKVSRPICAVVLLSSYADLISSLDRIMGKALFTGSWAMTVCWCATGFSQYCRSWRMLIQKRCWWRTGQGREVSKDRIRWKSAGAFSFELLDGALAKRKFVAWDNATVERGRASGLGPWL